MPAKNPEGRKHAIALRQRGMSVKEIAKALGHSPSSINLWVRDVVLTNKQKRALELRSPAGRTNTLNAKARTAASKSHRESARRARQEAQDRGALRVKEEGSGLFTAGCPLYWAGGTKGRNKLAFCNSDPHMMKMLVRFLTDACGASPDRLALSVNAKTNFATADQIENYWLDLLGLRRSCLRKGTFDSPRPVSGKRTRQLIHGICTVYLCDTQLLHEIYGGIQVLGGFFDPRMLD